MPIRIGTLEISTGNSKNFRAVLGGATVISEGLKVGSRLVLEAPQIPSQNANTAALLRSSEIQECLKKIRSQLI